ncbi:MAG TPA: hypothetical protein VFB04_08395 [Terriglobales bacterium]|nr:hypothetical protein [Terriglobales bacterium]
MKSLTITGCVLALISLYFLPPLFALLAMMIGVITLLKGRLENGVAVIVLAGACGYYGMSKAMPLDDFSLKASVKNVKGMFGPETQPVLVATPEWHVVSLETQVSKSEVDPVCTWKLVVRNDSLQPAVFRGVIEFQDSRGVKISQDRVEGPQIPAGLVGTFEGSLVIKGGTHIARAVPQLAVGG